MFTDNRTCQPNGGGGGIWKTGMVCPPERSSQLRRKRVNIQTTYFKRNSPGTTQCMNTNPPPKITGGKFFPNNSQNTLSLKFAFDSLHLMSQWLCWRYSTKKMLLVPLLDPAGVAGRHCLPHPKRLLQTKNCSS